MSFKIEDDYKVEIFGKEFNSLQHAGILIGYAIFLMIIWPLISSSYFFIPIAVAGLPVILPEFIYNEIYKNVKIYKVLLYSGIVITTFVYTYFIIECSLFISVLHFIVYSFFGYLFSKKLH